MDIWGTIVPGVFLVMATLITAHYARLGVLYKARYGASENLSEEDKQRLDEEIAAWPKGPFRPSAPGKVWQPILISLISLIIVIVLAGVLLWEVWEQVPWPITELRSTPAYLIYDFERRVPSEWSVGSGEVTLEISGSQAFTGRRSLALDMQLVRRSYQDTSGAAMIFLEGKNLENKLIVARLWAPPDAPINLWAGFSLGCRNDNWQDGTSGRLFPGAWSTLTWSTQDCAEWHSPATLGIWFGLGETSSNIDRLEWQGRVFVDTIEILDLKPVYEGGPSLDHVLEPVVFYDFEKWSPTTASALDVLKPSAGQYTRGISMVDGISLPGGTRALQMDVALIPYTYPDWPRADVLVPFDGTRSIDAFTASVLVPEREDTKDGGFGITLIAQTDKGLEYTSRADVPVGKWHRFFWGTRYVFTDHDICRDTNSDGLCDEPAGMYWHEWSGQDVKGFYVIVFRHDSSYTGPVYLDNLAAYQVE